MTATTEAVAGTAGGGTNQAAPVPGSLFGVPKYSTQRRLVPDNGNEEVAVVQTQGTQKNVPTTKLDQLDIVQGIKLYFDLVDVWTTGAAKTLHVSPFYPASLIQSIRFKLQAAYDTFNQTGPLAAIIQNYRPMWGNRGVGSINPDPFAAPSGANTGVYIVWDGTHLKATINGGSTFTAYRLLGSDDPHEYPSETGGFYRRKRIDMAFRSNRSIDP